MVITKIWGFYVLAFLVNTFGLFAQDSNPFLNLQEGDNFFLETTIIQETQSDNNIIERNLSLELNSKIIFRVSSIDRNGDYLVECHYQDLHLSFFSPQRDMAISSKRDEFSLLSKYLEQLEESLYQIRLSKYGECIHINGIDSTLNNLFYYETAADSSNKQIFIKTIKEAFGNTATTSLINTALHLYSKKEEKQSGIPTFIFFNARNIPLKKNLFYRQKEDFVRVQGIGLIEETSDTLSYNDFQLISNIKGNQSYDFRVNKNSGWIIEGISKQKIQSVSKITGHKELPEGLKIPSITLSDYIFKGGQLDVAVHKVR